MLRGQADGNRLPTMEMFDVFGFSERVLKEACWINETRFWKPDDKQAGKITRSGWLQDVEDGLSEFPHVVLNQARVHDFYLDVMRKSACKLEPYYARRVVFQQAHHELAVEGMPALLLPKKGRYGLLDYEKMFCPDIKSGLCCPNEGA
jgi:hypothetical protein